MLEKYRHVDAEIRSLSRELCVLIDAELERLIGSVYLNDDNKSVDECLADLALRVLRTKVLHVLTRNNAVSYTKRNFRDAWLSLKRRDTTLKDGDLEYQILDSTLLESRINFFNRLKIQGLIGLENNRDNLLPMPVDTGSLNEFIRTCSVWINAWGSELEFKKLHDTQREQDALRHPFGGSFWKWVSSALKTTKGPSPDLNEVCTELSRTYDQEMMNFERLRNDLDTAERSSRAKPF